MASGGRNPIEEWKILDFAREVFTLSEINLRGVEVFEVKGQSFKRMVEQQITSAGFNFQHGHPYLSPSEKTAVKYAADMRYGSELITYTMDHLQELDRLDVPGVRTSLFKKYTEAYSLLGISPAPILIEVTNVPIKNLADELGADANSSVEEIDGYLKNHPDIAAELMQQANFRLLSPVQVGSLKIWLINVGRHNGWGTPDYTLYHLESSRP